MGSNYRLTYQLRLDSTSHGVSPGSFHIHHTLRRCAAIGAVGAVQGLLGKNGELTAENEKHKARVAELESKAKRPAKTPSNSSVPLSRGQKANRPANEIRKKRTKASHPGVGRNLYETPDHVFEAVADACPQCAAAVTADDQSLQQLYDRIEIPPIKPVVTQVRRHGGVCPCCREKFLAPVPKGLEPGSPFGSSVVALAIAFHHNQAISLERLVTQFVQVFGLKVSEGAICNMFMRSMPVFANQVVGIKVKLFSTTIMGSDETTVRVNKVNWWQWVFHNSEACIHVIRPSRKKDVPAEFLGDFRPDFWVSDRLGSQQGWSTVEWQVCPEALARSSVERRQRWCLDYLGSIVQRDVRDVAEVGRLGEMSRLLRLLAAHSGCLINSAEVAAPLGLDRKTAQRYTDILAALFLVATVPAWSGNQIKRLIKAPKPHFLDSGLLAALLGIDAERIRADRCLLGPLLETFVYGELAKQAGWTDKRIGFFHYRTKEGREVDLVMEDRLGQIVGIEVKASAT